MSGQLQCFGATLSNPIPPKKSGYSCFLYDNDDKLKFHIRPGEVKIDQTFSATRLRVLHSSELSYWTFPESFSLRTGESLVFSLTAAAKKATVYVGNVIAYGFELDHGPLPDAQREHATMNAHADPYIHQLLSLAHVHALLGSTRQEFEADVIKKGIRDEVEIKKLTKEQFKVVNEANATVHLQGSSTTEDDQLVYDQTAMLATTVNARLAAAANALHPQQYDISKPEDRLSMINAAANGLFNKYYTGMGYYETTVAMSSSTVKKKYASLNVKLEAIKDIFESLALPEAALTDLLGAVTSFIDSTKELVLGNESKDLHNAKLVNFYSIQPPLGNPTLNHLAKMRMIYVQFNETTKTWTSNCASGNTYDLDVTVFTLDVELNRIVVSLVYDVIKQKLLDAAEADLDSLGPSGAPSATGKPIKVNGPTPIGPPPVPAP